MSDLEKSDREKKLEKFLNQVSSQKEWEINHKNEIKKLKKKFSVELEDYKYVKNINSLYQLKLGGYIRYINFNNELRWGGSLLKVYKDNDRNLMVIANSDFKRSVVSFEKNHIFYKNHVTYADKTRKLFISFLDDYNDNK